MLKICGENWDTEQENEKTRHPPIGGACTTKIRPKAIFRCFFSKFDKCRPEVADDVISSGAIDQNSRDIRVKFSDSTLNKGLIIRLVAGWSPLHAVFNFSLQPTENS